VARRLGEWLFALLLLLTALVLQARAGAYLSELGTLSSDEAAHFVSGLMVRDYLTGALGADPLGYAREYYAHYPKVAIGNWPPVFYALQGVWMALLPAHPRSVLALIALVAATTAWIVYLVLRGRVGAVSAGFGALLFLLLAPVSRHLSGVMAELPLTLFVTAAVWFWIRFVDGGRGRDAALFGAATVLAVLTKGNGLLLCLVPPLSILLGRHWGVLRSRPLWYTCLAAVVVAAPWTWFFFDTVRAGWSSMDFSAAFTGQALAFYTSRLVGSMGIGVAGAVAIGAWARMGPDRSEGDGAIWSAAAAAIIAVILFHSLVPAGLETRHLIIACPFVAILAAAGVRAVAVRAERRLRPRTVALAIVVATAGSLTAALLRIPRRVIHGYGAAAGLVRSLAAPGPGTALIASDPIGEGAYIVGAAIRDPARPRDTVWRASKLLASATWAGRDYQLRARDEPELLRLIDRAGIRWVVLDRTADDEPHLRLLERAIADRSRRFRLRRQLPVTRPDRSSAVGISVYEVVGAPGGPSGRALKQVPGYDGVEAP
jgi:hypothetical protein